MLASPPRGPDAKHLCKPSLDPLILLPGIISKDVIGLNNAYNTKFSTFAFYTRFKCETRMGHMGELSQKRVRNGLVTPRIIFCRELHSVLGVFHGRVSPDGMQLVGVYTDQFPADEFAVQSAPSL